MSEPTRYSIVADYQAPWAKMHEFRSGDWVKYEDYARLHSQFANSEQENARLKTEVERLKAEGDRLKEAGDEMAFHIGNDEESQRKCADRWFDLREGKPSETKSPSFIEDLGNGVEKHDLLFRYPAKEGKQS